jgi:hypothetical protein
MLWRTWSEPPDAGPAAGGEAKRSSALTIVRAELEGLVSVRVLGPLTSVEQARYNTLCQHEAELLAQTEPHRDTNP